ncbi:hypothetical protein V493_06774 [Pseudogymnoascus sp. VKM F-4281 (FW-2241)]|nr:hypothetical protein V493_06774 [Pseudogymnoascus sp. VKM F-4281 (FW-2241)]
MAALEKAHLRMANLGDELALCFDDEVICEGSDAEDSPLAKAERQKRREAIELRYLAGHAPLIMSAQLRGPFDKNSGWVNPWRSKRPAQKQPANGSTATEHPSLAHKTTSIAGLGKRSRNDSNSSSSVGMRTKALAEYSSTSLDIVNNRQPERARLHSVSKRFAANHFERPTDFANLNERENISQNANAGIKRRADSDWLKGADVGKRSRNSWSDPTSPTPKERIRDNIGNDKAIIDASIVSMSNVNIANFNQQLPAETASLSQFEDIPVPTADFVHSKRTATKRRGDGNIQPSPHVPAKLAEDKWLGKSRKLDSSSRSPSTCRWRPPNREGPRMESASNARIADEDGLNSATNIDRTAIEHSLDKPLFVESASSFGHQSVQSCASMISFEPSPVRTFSRAQLSEEILHGLSQASQLACSAEQLTPLKLGDSTLNIEEQYPPDVAKRNSLSFSSNKTPSQIAAASLNHASQTRSRSHPLPKSSAEAKMLKSKRSDQPQSFDSPLPPGSLKYRRVRRKAPSPAKAKQDIDASTVIEKQKTLKAGTLQSTEAQDNTHRKDVVSSASQLPNHVHPAKPEFSTSDFGKLPSGSVPIIEITDNDAVENLDTETLNRDIDERVPTRTSVPPISPAVEDGASGLKTGRESCLNPMVDDRGSESSFNAPIMRCRESGESESLVTSQRGPGSQPPCIENVAKINSGGVEHREGATSSKATTSVVAAKRSLEDVTLSQESGSPLAAPELTDNESTLGQMIRTHTSERPNMKSSPWAIEPDIVDDDQLSEASFISAAEESNLKSLPAPAGVEDDQGSEASFTSFQEETDSLPVPQSPWVADEVSASKSRSAEPTIDAGDFSMSQSKDAALLLADTEPRCSSAKLPNDNVELPKHISELPKHNSESLQTNKLAFSGPASSWLVSPASAPPSPKNLSPRRSHTPQSARVGNHDILSLSTPWVNNTQSPIVNARPVKRKKRVSFNPLPHDSDNRDKQAHQPNNASEPRDLSSPPPPPESESLTEGDNAFHRKLKWTSGILSKRASKDRLRDVYREDTIPDSPGVGAMAEAFLAADAKVKSADSNFREVCDKNVLVRSENFDVVGEGETQDKVIAPSAVRAIPLMTESQLVNPWGDEDEVPPFSMADCGPEEDDGLVENVLSDMDAMLGDWNVDAELNRAKREARGKEAGRDLTARERLVEGNY